MTTRSYYVETGPMENTGLDNGTRFATRAEAEQALGVLLGARDRRGGFTPEVCESREEPNSTFAEWNEKGW